MKWLRKALGLDVIAETVTRAARDAADAKMHASNVAYRSPPPPPPPFVAVLIEGSQLSPEDADEGPVFMGQSAHVAKDHCFEFRPNWPMRDVRIIVFCDLERVDVFGAFAGTSFLNAVIGECPTARLERWPLGVILRVQVRARP